MAIDWQRPKDPSEIVDYAHDWSADLGEDTIVSSVWEAVQAAGTALQAASTAGARTRIVLTGGIDGQIAMWLNRITTAGGNVLEQAFRLRIVDAAAMPATPDRRAELEADLESVRKARLEFITTGVIREIWRDGRRIVRGTPRRVEDYNAAIQSIQADLDALPLPEGQRRRFRALRPRFH